MTCHSKVRPRAALSPTCASTLARRSRNCLQVKYTTTVTCAKSNLRGAVLDEIYLVCVHVFFVDESAASKHDARGYLNLIAKETVGTILVKGNITVVRKIPLSLVTTTNATTA